MQFAVQTNGCILKKIMLLHFLQWKIVATILYSPFEWNSYVIHDWFATAKWFLNTWLALWKIPDAVLVRYAAIMPTPTMLLFRCLLPFVSTYCTSVSMQGWILREVNEKQSLRVPIFSEITRVLFESFALSFCLAFSSHRTNLFWKDQTD